VVVAPVRPRLLDLFCGAGGAAMGYARAGFEVVGIDIAPQPRYPFEFIQADAIEYLSETGAVGFDAIHASPPCQSYSIMRNLPWLQDREYWDSVPPTRAALLCFDLPWVIENVQGAPLDGITLCGTMFGLRQPNGAPEYRHRLFASSEFMLAPGHPKHFEAAVPGRMPGRRQERLSGIVGGDPWKSSGIDRGGVGHSGTRKDWGLAVGIDWMDREGLSQAIPPAYTEYIGAQLLRAVV
jgi:DNA (cytosine-5)-methyltransferase 1